MKMLKRKERLGTELKMKLVLMFLLFLIFVINIFLKAFGDKTDGTVLNSEMESEAITENLIRNLDEFATPMLEGDAVLLNKRLENYVSGMGKTISSAEIFYVVVSETDEECLDFYVKLFPEEEIVKLTFDYRDSSVVASACGYSEEEIKNEIWNESAPAIRDMQ